MSTYRILAAAPEVTIIATSRERLHLQGEWVYEVSGLKIPTSETTDSFEGYGAIDYLNERLRQVQPRVPLRRDAQVVRIPTGGRHAARYRARCSLGPDPEPGTDRRPASQKPRFPLHLAAGCAGAARRSMRAVFNQILGNVHPGGAGSLLPTLGVFVMDSGLKPRRRADCRYLIVRPCSVGRQVTRHATGDRAVPVSMACSSSLPMKRRLATRRRTASSWSSCRVVPGTAGRL